MNEPQPIQLGGMYIRRWQNFRDFGDSLTGEHTKNEQIQVNTMRSEIEEESVQRHQVTCKLPVKNPALLIIML